MLAKLARINALVRRITELAGRELKWAQPHAFRMEYELRAGEEIVAVLRFRSSFGTHARAESADGCWTFERVGFWRDKTVVRAGSTKTVLAVFKSNKWDTGGTLELPGGRRFYTRANFWQTEYEIRDHTGEPLLRLFRGGVIHLSAAVAVHPSVARWPELPWLVMLGWYLMVMMEVDAASATI